MQMNFKYCHDDKLKQLIPDATIHQCDPKTIANSALVPEYWLHEELLENCGCGGCVADTIKTIEV